MSLTDDRSVQNTFLAENIIIVIKYVSTYSFQPEFFLQRYQNDKEHRDEEDFLPARIMLMVLFNVYCILYLYMCMLLTLSPFGEG